MIEEASHGRYHGGKAWGFWATMGFSTIIVAVYLMIHFVGMVLYGFHLVTVNPAMTTQSIVRTIAGNGFLLAVVTCVSVLPCCGLIFLFIWLRKGITWKEYLGAYLPRSRDLFLWLGITALYGIATDVVTSLIGRPPVPEFWMKAYDSSVFPPLLFFALLVAAPLNEEIFFRGFMLAGIRDSVLGAIGAVLIPSLLWTVVHMQYDLYELSTIFVAGIILGIARLRTNSVFTTLAIHALINVWACFQILWYSRT